MPQHIHALRNTVLATALTVIAVASCKDEQPPAPAANAEEPTGEHTATFDPNKDAVVFTFAQPGGKFADKSKLADVPDNVRGFVRVTLLAGAKPPPGEVWVANLQEVTSEVTLQAMAREQFEELALGQGLASRVELPPGLEPPEAIDRGELIVYKTSWCGVCKKLESYLRRKGVDYVAKDIERDREAAAELQSKASEAGVSASSVPVIDVGGELVVGFDRARLERLL